VVRILADRLGATPVQIAGNRDGEAGRVGIVCGSGGDLVAEVAATGCDTLVTGELKLHHACEARAAGMAVIAVGHHASEHFSLAAPGARLLAEAPGLALVASARDRYPITLL